MNRKRKWWKAHMLTIVPGSIYHPGYVCVFVRIYTLRELSSQQEDRTPNSERMSYCEKSESARCRAKKKRRKKLWTKQKIQSDENKSKRIDEVVWILRRTFESTRQQNCIEIHGKMIIIYYTLHTYILYIYIKWLYCVCAMYIEDRGRRYHWLKPMSNALTN